MHFLGREWIGVVDREGKSIRMTILRSLYFTIFALELYLDNFFYGVAVALRPAC